MKKLAAIAVALVLLSALAFLCLKLTKFSGHEHEQFQTALWRLKHLDTTFKEGVLEARFALLDNYDDFQTQEEELTRLAVGLKQTPTFIRPTDRTAIEQARAQYAVLSQERKKLFDRFKSQNAMLANSRRYLPGALDELAARLQEGNTNRELQDIVGGVTRLTLMRLSSPDELPVDAPIRLQQLKQWAATHPQDAESMFVLSIVRHAQNIVAGNGELDVLTRQLLALPTTVSIERLFQAYEIQVAKALRQAQQYRVFLYVLGFLVLIGITYIFWALRSANRNLGRRVAERTRELAGSEERFRNVFNLQFQFIAILSPEGRVRDVNDLPLQVGGVTREEVTGQLFWETVWWRGLPAMRAAWPGRLAAAARTEGPVLSEDEFNVASGEVRVASIAIIAVRNALGELECFIVQGNDITERKRSEAELVAAHKQLLETSRQAGMAEVATSVLHNVGNVLNSVNVSSTLIAGTVRKSKAVNLAKVVQLLREHEADLSNFLTNDPKGKQVPEYLAQLADHLAGERTGTLEELARLQKGVEHIKDIVSKQQSYAVVSGVTETVKISDLVDDALQLNIGSLARHDVEAIREFADVPPLSIEKHKVLQILVNLISNAKNSCDDSGRADKRMTVRVTNGEGSIKIAISDNGVGIPAENLVRIFNHGFTTRKTGHGFGLHSGSLAAKQLGGELRVQSDGAGHGATFTLELPLQSSGGAHG